LAKIGNFLGFLRKEKNTKTNFLGSCFWCGLLFICLMKIKATNFLKDSSLVPIPAMALLRQRVCHVPPP